MRDNDVLQQQSVATHVKTRVKTMTVLKKIMPLQFHTLGGIVTEFCMIFSCKIVTEFPFNFFVIEGAFILVVN